MKVEVIVRHRNRRVGLRRVRDVVKRCSALMLPRSVVSVAFLGDQEMAEINEAYTGRPGTTDVLSFPLGIGAGSRRWHGEVLISLDRASSQARAKGVLLIHEVIRLLIHAMVHLRGLDHHDKKGFREMRRVEFGLLLKCLI